MTAHVLEFDFTAGQVSCTVAGCNCEAMPVPLSPQARARIERDAAIAQVEAHSPPEWRVEAWDFLTEYLRTHETMHVDSLWDAGLPVPPELRALGALFNRAVRAGLMTKTDRYLPSVRSHLSPKVVWRSLSFEGER